MSANTEGEHTKFVRVSRELVEHLSTEWSRPVRLRIHSATSKGGNIEEIELIARYMAVEDDHRDAERYRALADAIGDERIEVFEVFDATPVIGSLGLEALCWKLHGERAARAKP